MDNLDILKIASKKLKSSREKLNISTKEVADDLRLDQKIIDDIDNGNFKNFKLRFSKRLFKKLRKLFRSSFRIT